MLAASSSGRVMVTSIWSMGITPLSMPMTMRGKSVDGKTATGMVVATYAPANAITMMRKITDLELRTNQWRALPGVTARVPFLIVGASAMRSVLGLVFFRGIALTVGGVGLLDLDLGLIRQPVSSLADHLFARLESGDD